MSAEYKKKRKDRVGKGKRGKGEKGMKTVAYEEEQKEGRRVENTKSVDR